MLFSKAAAAEERTDTLPLPVPDRSFASAYWSQVVNPIKKGITPSSIHEHWRKVGTASPNPMQRLHNSHYRHTQKGKINLVSLRCPSFSPMLFQPTSKHVTQYSIVHGTVKVLTISFFFKRRQRKQHSEITSQFLIASFCAPNNRCTRKVTVYREV